jgi:hypothetical protein
MSSTGGALTIISGLLALILLVWLFWRLAQPWLQQLAEYLKRGWP